AHVAHLGRREEPRRDRVGDLVLDQLRSAARPLGEDDHLHVGEVGERTERRAGGRQPPAGGPPPPRRAAPPPSPGGGGTRLPGAKRRPPKPPPRWPASSPERT